MKLAILILVALCASCANGPKYICATVEDDPGSGTAFMSIKNVPAGYYLTINSELCPKGGYAWERP